MGHLIFAVLHIAAAVFAAGLLFISVPGHLIYGVLKARSDAARAQREEAAAAALELVRCPECREPIRYDATRCKHCGATVQPSPAPTRPRGRDNPPMAFGLALLVMLAVGVAVTTCH